MLTKNDIITGEKLQELFISNKLHYYHTHDAEKQMTFNTLLPSLKGHDNIILTHNSDQVVNELFSPALDSNKVTAWFAQNVALIHPKLHAVPIGLANSKWPHGNLNIFEKYLNRDVERTILCYFGYKVSTYPPVRKPLKEIIQYNHPSWKFIEDIPFEKYCETLSRSKYCICPRGNGLDTHRLWECLYYKVIPLVDRNPVTEYFEHLGLVIVDDWNKITEAYLNENYDRFYNKLQVLTMSHYQDIIKKLTRTVKKAGARAAAAPPSREATKLCIAVYACATIEKYRYEIVKINETWGKRAKELGVKVLFFLGEEPTEFTGKKYIYLKGIKNDYESASYKQNLGLKYVYEKYNPDFVHCCGSDTYIHIDRLLNFVKQFNPSDNLYLGGNGDYRHVEKGARPIYFHSGGPGFILTRTALRRLYPSLETMFYQWRNICIKNNTESSFVYGSDICIAYFCNKIAAQCIFHNDGFFFCPYYDGMACYGREIDLTQMICCHNMTPHDFDNIHRIYYSNIKT